MATRGPSSGSEEARIIDSRLWMIFAFGPFRAAVGSRRPKRTPRLPERPQRHRSHTTAQEGLPWDPRQP
eukprot:4439462-Pyramimonas_sp.AAC.1